MVSVTITVPPQYIMSLTYVELKNKKHIKRKKKYFLWLAEIQYLL